MVVQFFVAPMVGSILFFARHYRSSRSTTLLWRGQCCRSHGPQQGASQATITGRVELADSCPQPYREGPEGHLMLASKEAKFLKMQLPPVTEALMQCSGLRSVHFYLAKVQPSHLKPCIFLSDANCTLIFLVRCLPER
ncbi:hypothetical protein ISCGN_005104 [Ixodes scapularis]